MKSRRRRPRSPRERDLLAAATAHLGGGVRNTTTSPDYAMVMAEGKGSRVRDFSGNEYVDYLLGSGAILLGHAHPAVVGAVREQLERGSSFLLVNEPAILLAEEIVKAVPCAEMVSFHSTGSEAVSFALRLARAHRGREKILKFEGAFHGMSDYALMSNQWTGTPPDYPAAAPNSAGIPQGIAEQVLIAPFNDLETTVAVLEKHHDELAAVIVEPMQRTIPPQRGFLAGLREVTRSYGIPLIFDEMVTGFRLAYGGAQQYYGVVPDLCAIGKSMSAGFPISAVCGSAEIMSRANPARHASGDHVALTGTFSANPVSCVAALAALQELRREGVYAMLFATGQRLMTALRELLGQAGIPAQVIGEPPAFEVWFTDREITDFRSSQAADMARHARFTQLLLDRGVMKAHEKFFVSTAHSEEDVKISLDAFESAIEELKKTTSA